MSGQSHAIPSRSSSAHNPKQMFEIEGQFQTPRRLEKFVVKCIGVMDTWYAIMDYISKMESRCDHEIEWNAECGLETQELLEQGTELHFYNECRPDIDFIRVRAL